MGVRDWVALLTDAKARGLSRVAVARELGIGRGEVNNACKYHGIDLDVSARHRKGRTTPRSEAELTTISERIRRRWQRVFAEAPPSLSINAFCFRYKCGPDAARKWAAEFGYEFGTLRARS